MKKWIISLSIVLMASIVGGGVTLGRVFKEDLKLQEVTKTFPLDAAALKNVSIEGDCRIILETTDGAPYVELNSRVRGLVGQESGYEVKINAREDSTSIKISNNHLLEPISFMIEDDCEVRVYLPKQDMDSLQIIESSYGYYPVDMGVSYHLGDINIKNLEIEARTLSADLTGNYEEVKLRTYDYGNMKINSQSPMKLSLSGEGTLDLKGQYKEVNMEYYHGTVTMDSSIPTTVRIGSYGGDFKFNGAYKEIKADGGDGVFYVNSNTQCDVQLGQVDGTIQLLGKIASVEASTNNYAAMDIRTEVVPERLKLDGYYEDITLQLPSTVKGFTLTGYLPEEAPYSEFNTTVSSIPDGTSKILYGGEELPITIGACEGKLSILKGKGTLQEVPAA